MAKKDREKFPIYNPRGNNSTGAFETFNRPTWTYEQARNQDFVSYSKLNERESIRLENHPFMWPGPGVTNIGGSTQPMIRGFMRSILYQTVGTSNTTSVGTSTDGKSGIRLNFQFNPEYIQRDVSQSPGAVNPLLQSVTNLTQPVPGTAQFNFTLTFNREHEVAALGDRVRDSFFNFSQSDERSRETINETLLTNPGLVGVMHDLAIFDKIIGQGISQELVDTLLKYTEKVADLQEVEEGEDVTAFDAKTYGENLNANFGNSAFLNPLPVRIVFGDLFMVEGFVTGSAVAFQKFSRQMIPTICQINCNVSALYFGFAQKSAFVTDNLQKWYESELGAEEQTKKDIAGAEQVVQNMVTRMQYVINSSLEGVLSEDDYNLDLPDANTDGMKVWRGTSTGQYYPGNSSGYVTLPQWFNAFSDQRVETTGTKANEIYNVFTSGQRIDRNNVTLSKTLVGWLPFLVVIDVLNPFKEGSTTSRMTAKEMPNNLADFGIEVYATSDVSARVVSTNTKTNKTIKFKTLSRTTPGGGGGNSTAWYSWEKISPDSRNTSAYQWYGVQGPTSSSHTQYMRIFWLNPSDVGEKEVINLTDNCELVFQWSVSKSTGENKGVVNLKEQAIPYKFNTPFISNTASNQLKSVNANTIRKQTGSGPRNAI